MVGPTLPSVMAGKRLVETPAAEAGVCGRIGGWSKAVGGGDPKPLGKVESSIIDCILERPRSALHEGDRGKIVSIEGAPCAEASGSGTFAQGLPFPEGIVVA